MPHWALDSRRGTLDADFGLKISIWPIIFAYFAEAVANHDVSGLTGGIAFNYGTPFMDVRIFPGAQVQFPADHYQQWGNPAINPPVA